MELYGGADCRTAEIFDVPVEVGITTNIIYQYYRIHHDCNQPRTQESYT